MAPQVSTPVRQAAPAAAPVAPVADPYADQGVVPTASDGAQVYFPDAALLMGFQLFNWDATAQTGALGRIQAQFAVTLPGTGKMIVAEIKTAKVPLAEIVEAGKALRQARPDLNATMKLLDYPRGRKGAYHIRQFGVIDRNLNGGGDQNDPYAD